MFPEIGNLLMNFFLNIAFHLSILCSHSLLSVFPYANELDQPYLLGKVQAFHETYLLLSKSLLKPP